MRSSFLHTALLASAMIAATGAAPASAVAEPSAAAPLIPRELFFGEPERTVVRISPDGRSLSWLAPRNGVLNLWVAPVDDPAAARPLTSETGHPIARHLWAPDSKSLLFLKDNDGDENYRLFAAPVDGSPIRTLLSVDGAQVLIQAVSTPDQDLIAVSINDRDRKLPTSTRSTLRSGQRTLLLRNDGHLGKFLFDDDVDLRLATKPASDGGYDLYKVTKGTVAAEPYERIPFEEMQTSRPLGFSGDGHTLYWTDSRGRDTAALVAEDVASGKRRVIASDAHADLSDLVTDPISGKPLAYAANYLTTEYRRLDRTPR